MNCAECGNILDSHGNARYCPEKNNIKNACYKNAKAERQKKRLENKKIEIAENARIMGYLEGIMSSKQQIEIPVEDFPSFIFTNKNCKISIINKSEIYKMENFQIAKITTEVEEKIQITKLNNHDEFSI